GDSSLHDKSTIQPNRTERIVSVPPDDEPDLRERACYALFFTVFEMDHRDNEIGLWTNLRQDLFKRLDGVQNVDAACIFGMAFGFQILGCKADESEAQSLCWENHIFLDLFDGRHQVRRQHRKLCVAQPKSQRILAVVKFMIADRASHVTDLVHGLDRRRALEF